MTKLVLIGCGENAVTAHLPALQRLHREDLVDVVLSDAEPGRAAEAADRFDLAHAEDWRVAASGADAVAICVPPGPNVPLAIEALDRGLHVLTEKPPARDLAGAEALADAAERHPELVTLVGFNRRFAPLYQEMMARSHRLGAPSTFFGRFSRLGPGPLPSDGVSDWITSDSSHALDLAIACVGLPSAISVSRRAIGPGPDNVWSCQLHTDDGSAVLFLHFAAGGRAEEYTWAGPGYHVHLAMPSEAHWTSGEQTERLTIVDVAGRDDRSVAFGFEGEYRAFLDAVAGGPRPDADFGYARDFMALVDAILSTDDREIRPLTRQSASSTDAPARAAVAPQTRPTLLIGLEPADRTPFLSASRLAELGAVCDVRTWTGEAVAGPAAVITGRGARPLPPDVLELVPELGLVVVLGASVTPSGAGALVERGVAVTNTAAAVGASVAEHCLLLTLAGLRHLATLDARMHRGEWVRPGVVAAPASEKSRVALVRSRVARSRRLRRLVRRVPMPAAVKRRLRQVDRKIVGKPAPRPAPVTVSDLRGAVVGLVGWGHVAREFARLLEPFGCRIVVASDAGPAEELAAVGARRGSLAEVLSSSAVVSLHKGLNAQSRGLIGAEQLALLKPGTVLVNTARGELVDEEALADRLAVGDIVAALDVFDVEPLPRGHRLQSLENVILTPHMASATLQEQRRMGDQAADTVLAWVAGDDFETIDSGRLARMT